jgi:DNA-binding transcriptional LysR family regulator
MFEELFSRDGLSLERLHALIQLGEEGSLTRAAKGDPGKQSRMSHRLKELSAFFGVALTDRVGRKIRLTEAGERLVKLAREHFQELTHFMLDSRGSSISYRLGSADSLVQWLAVPAVAKLRRPGAGVRFTLQNLRGEEIVDRLQDQRLEFGLVSNDVALHGLKSKAICRVGHIIVVPERVSIRRGLLTLKQALLDCPHAAMPPGYPMRQAVDQVAKSFGKRFEPQLECENEAQCAAAVRTGQFAAVLPLWAWESSTAIEHLVCEDPALAVLEQRLLLVWHPRLLVTRGSVAEQIKRALCAALSECAAASSKYEND